MARKQHKNEILSYLICPILFFVGLLIGYGAQSPSQSQPSGGELLHTEENTFITQGGQVASRFSPTKKKTIPQGFKRNIIQQIVIYEQNNAGVVGFAVAGTHRNQL